MADPSSTTTTDRLIACPKCAAPIDLPAWPGLCDRCGVPIGVIDFDPLPDEVAAPAAALPDDVACIHHPAKKATDVCAGSGSYICALCVVNLLGETYSAAFIESGGLEKLKKADALERQIERPGPTAQMCAFLSLVLSCTIVGGPVFWGIGVWLLFRHRKAMRDGGFYARRLASGSTTAVTVLLLIVSLLVNGATIGVIIAGLLADI